ncbi:aminoglycoside 3'-phosphotransferase [Nocardia jejuensis]|uniref:aminoglycoside 3'-phosphotransferase n=1 Tax=Nocardia jejuensis TaxID=328049 RepID=UPI0009FE7DFE|nr:aminoglycoside 3'-phosphotransferase [Nocardia jejuensis]
MGEWESVTSGCSGATVRRSPDGRSHAKSVAAPASRDELIAERDRLLWLATGPIAAPRVLDWNEDDTTATLVTSTLPGIPASEVPAADVRVAVKALVGFLESLHALPVRECPFDRTLAVTVPAAAMNAASGLVDEDDLDECRFGSTAEQLLLALAADRGRAEVLEIGDLAICHGDFCLPNVFLDPGTLTVTGILDVGRLGVADRHLDLALLTRSLEDTDLNPAFGAELSESVRDRTEADPWRIDYYRLLDEFF